MVVLRNANFQIDHNLQDHDKWFHCDVEKAVMIAVVDHIYWDVDKLFVEIQVIMIDNEDASLFNEKIEIDLI